ncbi:MAG: hypothetical protein JWN65_2709 [Solirubrobacterales bacterium]|nr:hypothetical protein [Solirubrobacterales bacterium]
MLRGPGDDQLEGNASVNALSGEAANDILRGSGGDDVLDGGDGNDALDVCTRSASPAICPALRQRRRRGPGRRDGLDHLRRRDRPGRGRRRRRRRPRLRDSPARDGRPVATGSGRVGSTVVLRLGEGSAHRGPPRQHPADARERQRAHPDHGPPLSSAQGLRVRAAGRPRGAVRRFHPAGAPGRLPEGLPSLTRGCSSVGRASAFQAECRRFEPGRPLDRTAQGLWAVRRSEVGRVRRRRPAEGTQRERPHHERPRLHPARRSAVPRPTPR